jgi:CheY-specific phosphatase CheX
MGIKFFGQFLLERRVISAEELLEAVEYQEAENLKFGDYALSKGYLDAMDVRRLNDEQRRTDMMIGELAVKLRMMSSEQVDELLTRQRNDHMFIGEALVRKGTITPDILEKELERFKEDQKDYTPWKITVPEGLKDSGTVSDIVDLTQKLLRRMAQVEVKVGEGVVVSEGPGENFSVVSVLLTGNLQQFEYVLSVPREVATRIASGILDWEASSEPDEIVADGVREFCNIVCGNVIARLAKRGMSVEITPPSDLDLSSGELGVVEGSKAVSFPMVSIEGEMTLIVIEY